MAKYEATLLFNKDEKEAPKIVEAIFKSAKVTVIKADDGQVKTLAYPIKKQQEAHYLFWQIEGEPKQLPVLLNKITLEEKILRSLVVKTK